eukprot:4704084-Heterocapsa_arctica.AAC.1
MPWLLLRRASLAVRLAPLHAITAASAACSQSCAMATTADVRTAMIVLLLHPRAAAASATAVATDDAGSVHDARAICPAVSFGLA